VYRCTKCGEPWDDSRAQDNDLYCTKRCGGRLELVPPPGLADLYCFGGLHSRRRDLAGHLEPPMT
jgi:hypothetical protein